MQEDFASLCKIIDKKDHTFPNFPFPIEIKNILSPPTPANRLPPSPTSNSSTPP